MSDSKPSHKSIWDSVVGAFDPIHREGYKFIIISALATLVLFLIWPPLGWIALIVTLAMAYFFRDPSRATPVADNLLIAPADGKLIAIRRRPPPPELSALGEAPMTVFSTFLSLFNVHVVRAPVSGRVISSRHEPGLFLNAESEEASEQNERQAMVIERPDGERIGVVLIAGYVARRIVPFVKEGDTLSAGQRIGIIRFGSRVDVYAPGERKMMVGENQRMVGGETVLTDLAGMPSGYEVRVR
ncbi:phosphatidylserine decarboxylase [Dichotomicrobium thermohalophilum]|uniref:Phosphatidylserine decarboxylase proenzyme n=1 Tax=Dichotomicrobium thermohalophilum TaxID=933063 RepID=A0A397PDG1_9HYPH|nr:phosphatidylserine decarboxylase [Dichotomicrobium thermohalophilum]RIA47540.1 phosphatidylserine decarboxylase [Dichotomicrobium thermohalophilum]